MPKLVEIRNTKYEIREKTSVFSFLSPKLYALRSTLNANYGFTLIELMVAIAIVAVLATIGITVFTGLQKNGRDTRRAGDINAISKAFETHYLALAGLCEGQDAANVTDQPTYCPLQGSWFTSGIVPVDPLGSKNLYCMTSNDTSTVIPDPAPGAAMWDDCANVSATTTWVQVGAEVPDWDTDGVAPFTAWKVCARKEGQAQVICTGSSQL